MKKPAFVLLFALLLSLLLPTLGVSAESAGRVTVLDNAGMLSGVEEAALESGFGDRQHGTLFYLVTSSTPLTVSAVRSLCGIASGESAAVLVIDRQNGTYYYELFTFGHIDGVLSRRACDAILDDDTLHDAIKGGRIYDGAARFFTLTEARIERDWYDPGERFGGVGVSIAVGIVVSLLAGGGAALGVFSHYRKKRHGESYPLDRYANLSLTYHEDRFVGSAVTRVRVQSSSSGGRGGGGGGRSRGRR